MKAPKAGSNGIEPHCESTEGAVVLYGTCLNLHDRAGTFASLLYKAEKPSVCPSVCITG